MDQRMVCITQFSSCCTELLTSFLLSYIASNSPELNLGLIDYKIYRVYSSVNMSCKSTKFQKSSNWITVILYPINSLSLNYAVSSRCRTLLLLLSLKLLNDVISLPFYALSTSSESLNASNTSSSHLPTKFIQLPNLHTFITSPPINVLAVLTLHPSLLLLGHLHHPR